MFRWGINNNQRSPFFRYSFSLPQFRQIVYGYVYTSAVVRNTHVRISIFEIEPREKNILTSIRTLGFYLELRIFSYNYGFVKWHANYPICQNRNCCQYGHESICKHNLSVSLSLSLSLSAYGEKKHGPRIDFYVQWFIKDFQRKNYQN
jgi:hypothetical protein